LKNQKCDLLKKARLNYKTKRLTNKKYDKKIVFIWFFGVPLVAQSYPAVFLFFKK
jgi:hypothetical protein